MWEQRRLSTYLIICPFLLDHFTPFSMVGQLSSDHLNPPALFSCSSSLHYPILAFLFYAKISNGLKPFAFPSTNNEQKDYGRVN